jgi:hypothetical protein
MYIIIYTFTQQNWNAAFIPQQIQMKMRYGNRGGGGGGGALLAGE